LLLGDTVRVRPLLLRYNALGASPPFAHHTPAAVGAGLREEGNGVLAQLLGIREARKLSEHRARGRLVGLRLVGKKRGERNGVRRGRIQGAYELVVNKRHSSRGPRGADTEVQSHSQGEVE